MLILALLRVHAACQHAAHRIFGDPIDRELRRLIVDQMRIDAARHDARVDRDAIRQHDDTEDREQP